MSSRYNGGGAGGECSSGTPGHMEFLFTRRQVKGNAKAALDSSAVVVSAEFNTQFVHQAPLEPEASVAYIDGEGENAQLVVIGRSIRIHDHARLLKEALGWKNVRYQEAFVGGQFGIKTDLTSEHIAGGLRSISGNQHVIFPAQKSPCI